MSPVFRHGRLRLYLLRLLDEEPRHGYEVIRLLRDRFMGIYAPSPGTIYPRLARLEEEGLVTHDEENGRKVYRITEAGREELRKRSTELHDLEAELAGAVSDIVREVKEDVRDTVRSLREELTFTAREETREQARTAREDAKRRAQRIREEASHLRDDAISRFRTIYEQATGEQNPWAEGTQEEETESGCGDWGAAFRDLENLAGDFVADVRKAAREAESLNGDVLTSLRGLLDETLGRIRTEIFHSDDEGPSGKVRE